MKHSLFKAGLPLLAASIAACTTTGTGFGSSPSGGNPVTFTWTSSNAVSGTMTARTTDGKMFSGPFFQVTTNTRVDQLGPLWAGWGPGWRYGGWYDWWPEPQFITHYTGQVVANLAAPEGARMRCRFQLISPATGMAGGGSGECQLPDKSTVDVTFQRA